MSRLQLCATDCEDMETIEDVTVSPNMKRQHQIFLFVIYYVQSNHRHCLLFISLAQKSEQERIFIQHQNNLGSLVQFSGN